MKIANKITSLILILFLVVALDACGTQGAAEQDKDDSSISVVAVTTGDAAAETSTVAEELIPDPDISLGDDSVIGNWTDISDSSRFAKIEKTDTGYQYTDPEGTYPCTFDKGVLTLNVSDTDTAQVYFNEKSGYLFSVYQGNATKFSKSK